MKIRIHQSGANNAFEFGVILPDVIDYDRAYFLKIGEHIEMEKTSNMKLCLFEILNKTITYIDGSIVLEFRELF